MYMLALTSSHVTRVTHHAPHSPLWARVTAVWISQADVRIQTKGWRNFAAQAAQRGMDFGDQLTGRLDEGMSDSIFELATLV